MLIKFKNGDTYEHIQTDNIVRVIEWPATEEHTYFDEEYNEERTARAQPTRVDIITTGIDSTHDDGGDYYTPHVDLKAYSFTLFGQSAEDFIEQLDYTRVMEGA